MTDPANIPEPTPTLAAEPDPAPPADPAPTPDPAPEPEPDPAPQGAKPDWRDRRIAQLTARLREAQAQPKPAAPAVDPSPAPPAGDPAEFRRQVQSEAARLSQQNAFTQACTDTAAAGRLAFPDFDARVGQLTQLVDQSDVTSVQQYNTLVSAAIETGQGAALIHRLGGDLNEASRLLSLPPIKLAVELARMADRTMDGGHDTVGARKPLPKPITTVANRGASANATIDPRDPDRADQLDTAEWMRRREAQVMGTGTKH